MEESSPPGPALSEARRKRRRESSMSAESPREVGHMRRRHDTGSSSFVGSGSGIHFVRTVRQAFAKNSGRSSLNDEAIDDELVPGEDDRLQSRNSPDLLWKGDEVLFPIQGQEINFPKSTFDELVRWSRQYFDSWHPPLPYLHAPTFLGLLERTAIHTLTCLELADIVIIRSVMSISAADRRQTPPEEGSVSLVPAHLIYQSIEEALSSLQPMLIHPSSIKALQAAVSIQVFLISMLRLNAASRIGGFIVRMSYHLGLHRCPSRFPQFSVMEVEIRRRLFWSIYCIERYLSQALGLPLELKDDDLDVCFPDHEFHASGNASGPNRLSSLDDRRLMLPTALAKHGRIKGLILELRNKSILHSRTDPDEVSHIDAEISKWWNDAQELINPLSMVEISAWSGQLQDAYSSSTGAVASPSLKSSHKLLLLVQKHESVILLNRPVITSGYNTSAHASAIQKCIGASKAIVSIVYRHINDGMKVEGAQNGRINNPLFWPGFVWIVWQSGLILLYAAFEGHYSVQTAQREADCCVAILRNLSLRGNFWPSACAAAIKELQASLDAKTVAESVSTHTPGGKTHPRVAHRISGSAPQKFDSRKMTGDDGRRSGFSIHHYNNVSRMEDIETRSQANSRDCETENPSNQSPDEAVGPSNASRSIQHSYAQGKNMPGTIRTPSQTGLPLQQTTGSSAHQMYPAGHNAGLWPTMNGGLDDLENTFNGFDDIFQLIDVPYLLNDQFSQAQLGLVDTQVYPSIQ